MEYEVRPNTGSLHISSQKRTEKSPDFFGTIAIDREYAKILLEQSDDETIAVKLSAWKRESKTGNKFLSLAVDTYVKDAAPKSTDKDPWE